MASPGPDRTRLPAGHTAKDVDGDQETWGREMSLNRTRTCSWCGTPGHDRRSCTVPSNAGECSICNYHGHDRRNYPRK